MITFETLERLSHNCIQLISNAKRLESANSDKIISDAAEQIIGSLRKITIANELHDKQVICISGLQGAGKTTFIKNLYELDESVVNATIGRGEKIPVLICENRNCAALKMYVKELVESDAQNRQYEMIEREISQEEFVLFSSGNSERNVMYLELRVPFKHINNEHTAFMLLPGYEKKKDYWRSLIDFSLKCSDAAIFLFGESSFTQDQNAVLIDEITETFGNNLVYVISRSDLSLDGNASVKETCIETMGIPANQRDRVVCAGSFTDAAKNEEWIGQLLKALEKYCSIAGKPERECTKYICNEIEDTILNCIGKIRDAITGYESESIVDEFRNAKWLEAFDRAVEKARRKYSKHLKPAIAAACNDSTDKVNRIFTDKGYAKEMDAKRRTFGRALFGTKPKDLIKAQEIVRKSLYDEKKQNDEKKQIAFVHSHFITAMDETMGAIEESSIAKQLITETDEKPQALTFDFDSLSPVPCESAYSPERAKTLCTDIAQLFGKSEQVGISNDPKELLQLVAEIGTHYFAMNTVRELATNYQLSDIDLSKTNLTLDQITKGAKDTAAFGVGMLGLTGIDLATDGAINLAAGVASSLGITVGAAMAAVGAIFALGAGTVITRDINRMKCDDYNACKNAIVSVYQNIEMEYMALFDDYMATLRDKLEASLLKQSRVNQKVALVYNVQSALNSIEDTITEIFNASLEDEYGFRNLIS